MKRSILLAKAITISIMVLVSCRNSSFLDEPYNYSLVIPNSIADLQSILDNTRYLNGTDNDGVIPAIGEISSDDYYLSDDFYQNQSEASKQLYTWGQLPETGQELFDWAYPYRAIFYSNVALDGLRAFSRTPANQQAYDQVRGSALFYRAFEFYHLAQVFAPVYQEATAATDKSIALRLKSDINEKITQANNQQVYSQILTDLEVAATLLPDLPLYKTRPSRAAVYGLLARIHLSMRQYDRAQAYADTCIQLQPELLDYNDIVKTGYYSFIRFNKEVVFHSSLTFNYFGGSAILSYSSTLIDEVFLAQYSEGDLRRKLFFDPYQESFTYCGSYDGSQILFGGIATDEMYLIRAECQARNGQAQAAMHDLNELLRHRFTNETYIPLQATDAQTALSSVLLERRKELLMRGLRWTDLRRLNLEGAQITLYRTIAGQQFELAPNSNQYTFPIPSNVFN